MADRPSGDPAWEGSKSRGLPRLAAMTGDEGRTTSDGAVADEPRASDSPEPKSVARWLGWSPTSWRTQR